MTDAPWFTNTDFTSLEIKKYKSLADHTILNEVRIGDGAYIQRLAGRIAQIPPDGDMMISFADTAEHTELLFYSGEQVQQIDIIQRGFKTPSTGFNIKNALEKEIYGEIDAVLLPAVDKLLPKVENVEFNFGDFSLLYQGKDFVDLAPATVSFTVDTFTFRDGDGNIQLIKISSGQLPPQPVVLKTGGVTISLLTFHSKEQKRLYPDFFQVVVR